MEVFTHVTTATDPDNIKHVFDSVRDTITIQYIQGLVVPEWNIVE